MSLARFEANSDVWLGELVHSDEWSGCGWAFAIDPSTAKCSFLAFFTDEMNALTFVAGSETDPTGSQSANT